MRALRERCHRSRSCSWPQPESPADDLTVYLRGAGAHRSDSCVLPESMHIELVHVAVPSENLHRMIGRPLVALGNEQLGDRDKRSAVLTLGYGAGGGISQQSRSLKVGIHVSDRV